MFLECTLTTYSSKIRKYVFMRDVPCARLTLTIVRFERQSYSRSKLKSCFETNTHILFFVNTGTRQTNKVCHVCGSRDTSALNYYRYYKHYYHAVSLIKESGQDKHSTISRARIPCPISLFYGPPNLVS